MFNFNLLFFNISTGELVIVLLVLFLIFGPGKIPEIAKKLGRALYEVKRASSDIKREIDSEIRKIEDNVDITKTKKKEEKASDTQNTDEQNK